MKYYIPTTTLNFNNILSSESISPSSFFQKRGFGYSRWFEIPENKLNNSIVLYDSLSRFDRDDNELEDHPMIIEISTDDAFREINPGVYVTDKTIYLNPWQTKFIFFSEQDKIVTLSLSDSSLETKMIRLYQKGFDIHSPKGYYHPIKISTSDNVNNSEIEHDIIINRLKGLLYGYYIGAILSSKQSDVKHYIVLKELQNIFASILSNPLREPSNEQIIKVTSLIDSLIYSNPIFKEIEHIVKDRTTAIDIINVLNKYGKPISSLNPNYFLKELKESNQDYNPALQWVSNEIKRTTSTSSTNKKLLSPDAGEIIVADHKLRSIKHDIISDEFENRLFIGIINYILTDNSISGKISSQRPDLTDTFTGIAKSILEKNWESSPIRTYLNSLRRHVRGEEFNQEWNNGVLSSLAAVILKGDDWEVLLDFMKRKGMTDYRLAFAFYGAFNGFANLIRDFTDLLLNNDSTYVASIYKSIHHSIHGEEIKTSSRIIDIDRPKERCIAPTPSKSFKEKVMDFYYSNIRKGKKNQGLLDEQLRCALERIKESSDGFVFICVLNDFSLWKTKSKAWQQMQHEFCPDYNVRTVTAATNINPKDSSIRSKGTQNGGHEILDGLFAPLKDPNSTSYNYENTPFVRKKENFTSPTTYTRSNDITTGSNPNIKAKSRSIIYDDSAIEFIKSFFGINAHQILNLFTEFQKKYRNGYYSKHPEQYRQNNYDVIDHFCKWCLSKKNPNALKQTSENSRKFDELKDYLLRFYHD